MKKNSYTFFLSKWSSLEVLDSYEYYASHSFLFEPDEGLDDKVISFLQVPFSEHDTQSNIFVKKIQNNILFHITILWYVRLWSYMFCLNIFLQSFNWCIVLLFRRKIKKTNDFSIFNTSESYGIRQFDETSFDSLN